MCYSIKLYDWVYLDWKLERASFWRIYQNQFLLKIIKAAKTPGTHPHRGNRNTITIEPQHLPIKAWGGKIIANNTLKKLMW